MHDDLEGGQAVQSRRRLPLVMAWLGWILVVAVSLAGSPAAAGALADPYEDFEFCGDIFVSEHLDPAAFGALTTKDCLSLCKKVASDCKSLSAKVASCLLGARTSQRAVRLRNCGELVGDAAKSCKADVNDQFALSKLKIANSKSGAAEECAAFAPTCQSHCLPP